MKAYADACLVTVHGPDDFEGAVRRFAKAVREAGVLSELRRRESYAPPSVKRRLKQKRATKRRATARRRLAPDVDWKPTRV